VAYLRKIILTLLLLESRYWSGVEYAERFRMLWYAWLRTRFFRESKIVTKEVNGWDYFLLRR
jgi:hypothetical protein